MTETTRTREIAAEVRSLFVGDRPLIDSAIPPLVYVVANAIWGLRPAVVVAIGGAAALAAWRVVRGRPVLYTLGGVVAVAFAAGIAAVSGRSEAYFVPGIVSNALYAAGTVASILVRRPLVAWWSWFFRRWPLAWYWRDDVRPAYAETSWMWAVNFAAKGLVAWLLFVNGETGWLGIVKVLSSWPTILPLLVVTYVYGNWRLHRLNGPNVTEFNAGAEPPFASRQSGF